MEFKERFKKARLHKNLTQPELSKKVQELGGDLSQQAVSKIERGKQNSTTAILEVATVCGIRAEWLRNEEGEMLPTKHTANGQPQADDATAAGMGVVKPGTPSDDDIVDAVADLMGSGVTPTTKNKLIDIAQKAKDGKLSEDDILLLGQIADRIEKQ
jgi:transcriptional regulator with XRE-family HTH domain